MSFLSDLAFQNYEQLVASVRNRLLNTGPVAGTGEADLASMKYFLGVSTLSAANVFTATVKSEIGDAKTKEYYDKTVPELRKINESFQKLDGSGPDNETKVKTTFLEGNPAGIDPHAFAYNDTPSKPGEAVPGHDGAYGQALSNALEYDLPGPDGKMKRFVKSWTKTNGRPDTNTHSTPLEPMENKVAAMLEENRSSTPGSYKFFIEKMHGKSVSGAFYKKNEIKTGLTRDQIPNRMVFPAYIMNFNDSYAVDWADYKFIGRGEKVYTYESTTRTLTLEFYMMSDFSAELLIKAIKDYEALMSASKTANTPPGNINQPGGIPFAPDRQPLTEDEILRELQRIRPDWGTGETPNSSFTRGNKTGFVQGVYSGTPEQLWARYTFLAQCCYAWYRKDGKLKEQPFVRIRIGDFFDVIAKVDTLNYTQDEFDMDLNPSVVGAIPMGVRVSMQLTIVHEDEPTSDYPRFYHRKDFDGLNVNPYAVPDNIAETSKTLDSTLDNNIPKSPISLVSSLTDYGKSQTQFPNEVKAIQESLKAFGGSLKDLQASGGSFKDLTKGEKIKEALRNAKRLLDVGKEFDLDKVKDIKKHILLEGTSVPSKLKNPTSLANIPISDMFKSAKIPKNPNIPPIIPTDFG